jgi:hypothetical protein
MRLAYRSLTYNLFGKLWSKWKNNAKVGLRDIGCAFFWLIQGPVASSYEHCNEPCGHIKREQFLD